MRGVLERRRSGRKQLQVTLSGPDASGVRSATINLQDFREDCWTGTGALLDPSTVAVRDIEVEVYNANQLSTPTTWDFCISQLTIQ